MAAHNYIVSPTFPDPVVKFDSPTRTALTVDYSETDPSTASDVHYGLENVLGGDPPIIVGHTCEFQWSDDYTYATVNLDCAPQSITIPATFDGEPVRAVALYLVMDNTWAYGGVTGGGHDVERGSEVENCGLTIHDNPVSAGESLLEVFVDDTQVVSVHGAPPPTTSTAFQGDIFVTLPLPGIVRTPTSPYTPPGITPNGLPFHSVIGQTTPYSYLFWGPDEPGESFPDEISFHFEMTNVRLLQTRTVGTHDPGPFPGHSPASVLTSTTAYVDVYPYIALPESENVLMMVV